ncbi:MAG: hypothetical protein K0Q79_3171 [Flavipsychrobacter sp.]|jgi:cytochrome bd-type quinol oxidase subunit 2|nr:hypothetical protein [Flavipsychrobacter sp.]
MRIKPGSLLLLSLPPLAAYGQPMGGWGNSSNEDFLSMCYLFFFVPLVNLILLIWLRRRRSKELDTRILRVVRMSFNLLSFFIALSYMTWSWSEFLYNLREMWFSYFIVFVLFLLPIVADILTLKAMKNGKGDTGAIRMFERTANIITGIVCTVVLSGILFFYISFML